MLCFDVKLTENTRKCIYVLKAYTMQIMNTYIKYKFTATYNLFN